MENNFVSLLKSHGERVEFGLDALLQPKLSGIEVYRPNKLLDSMRYSTLEGGKRLRPFLVLESAKLFGVEPDDALFAALAVECIHCYSLVHDDLPAMDDDAMRRGKPTTHIEFDQATAILAGDGLLTLAFDVLATSGNASSDIRVKLLANLAQSAGMGGMVGGQNLDMDAATQALGLEDITRMQAMKTGCLIRCSCDMGAILGSANAHESAALTQYGLLIGQAFQLADDILDKTATQDEMGKAVAKDADQGKATVVDHFGLEKSKQMLNDLCEQAKHSLKMFGPRASILCEAAEFIASRKN